MPFNFGHRGFRRMLKLKLSPTELTRARAKYKVYDPKTEYDLPALSEMYELHPLPTPPPKPPNRKHVAKYEGRYYAGGAHRGRRGVPMERFVRARLREMEERARRGQGSTVGSVEEEEEYMSRLLGVTRRKDEVDESRRMAEAYDFAIRQIEVMREGEGGMSEEEGAAAVEELLRVEDRRERHVSRGRRREIEESVGTHGTDWRENVSKGLEEETEEEEAGGSSSSAVGGVPTVLTSRPRTVKQMSLFGEWLKAVPYEKWTLGAATALDHWIAVEILGVSEDNWKLMLKGDATVGVSRLRDVVAVREALFPETLVGREEDEEIEEERREAEERIDELLADLSGEGEDDLWKFDDEDGDEGRISEEERREEKNDQFLEELQGWREKRQLEGDYVFWQDADRAKYDTWQQDYMAFVAPQHNPQLIDTESTRESLLSAPPTTRHQNNLLWKNIADETDAEIFLDKLTRTCQARDDKELSPQLRAFFALPYEQQVKRLLTIGTLRALYDEYTSEKDFERFFDNYKHVLMEGVPVEYLVPDDHGAISSKHLADEEEHDQDEDHDKSKKYKVELKDYASETAQIERDIYKAYGQYKALRAQTEEDLFTKGEVTLDNKTHDDENN